MGVFRLVAGISLMHQPFGQIYLADRTDGHGSLERLLLWTFGTYRHGEKIAKEHRENPNRVVLHRSSRSFRALDPWIVFSEISMAIFKSTEQLQSRLSCASGCLPQCQQRKKFPMTERKLYA